MVGENTEVLYPKQIAELPQTPNRTTVVNQSEKPQPVATGGRKKRDVTDGVEYSSSNTHDEVVAALPSLTTEHEHVNVVSESTTAGASSAATEELRLSFAIPPQEVPMQLPRATHPPELQKPLPAEHVPESGTARKEVSAGRRTRHSKRYQQDYQVFSYGDEFEIVQLEDSPNGTNPHGTDVHDSKLTRFDEKVPERTETFSPTTDSPTDAPRHSKRVLVNVTIETEDDDEGLKPVYVVSLSVPTEGEPERKSTAATPTETPTPGATTKKTTTTTTTTTTTRYGFFYGGQCECSCPCLESDGTKETEDDLYTSTTESSTDQSSLSSASYERLVDYNVTEELVNDTTEATTTEVATTETDETTTEAVPSTTSCPVASPPPPVILLLEGETFSKWRILTLLTGFLFCCVRY